VGPSDGVRRLNGGHDPRRHRDNGDTKRPATISAAMRARTHEDYSITAVLRLLRHVIAHEQG
jgi:hypothetical protein